MAIEEQTAVRPRRPWIAALLSLLVAGLGQLYAGAPGRALAIYLGLIALLGGMLWSGLPKTFLGLIAFLLFALLGFLGALWDAVRLARRNRDSGLRWFQRWYWYAAVVALASILPSALLERSPVKSFRIPSGSMEPAVRVGDHVYADMTYYRSAQPARDDLVIYAFPEGSTKLARVIGLEGEQIEIRDKLVYLDGRRLADPWGWHIDSQFRLTDPTDPMAPRDNWGPLPIPAGTVFVLGDNRDNSFDSRFFGPVPRSSLQGRLLYVYWAADKSRIGQALK